MAYHSPSFGRYPLCGLLLVLLMQLPACGFDDGLPQPGWPPFAKNLPFDPVAAIREDVVRLASSQEVEQGKVFSGSYIVTFRGKPGISGLRFTSFRDEHRYHYFDLAQQYLGDPRVTAINYITSVDLTNPRDPDFEQDFVPPSALQLAWAAADGSPLRVDEVAGVMAEVQFASDGDAASILREWEHSGRIWFAEPNYANELLAPLVTTETKDAYTAANVWWHKSIKLYEAYEKIAASAVEASYSPVIAVLDSGVDVQNPALADAIWTNEVPGQSGCPGDANGCDTTVAQKGVLGSGAVWPYLTSGHGQACPTEPAEERGTCEHGTHVTGIIAARVGQGASGGLGGVCPVCRVMPIKIIRNLNGKGVAPDSAILNGLKYLSLFRRNNSNVVRVANTSFGKYTRSRAVALVISVLKKPPNEVLLIGAAGNEDSMQRVYPAAFNDAIAVSAVSDQDGKAGYSNFGPWVDVAAPGGDKDGGGGNMIVSTVPGGDGPKQGTSMASPVVAGVAGLILAMDPTRGFDALRSSIVNRSDPRLYRPEVNGGLNYAFYYPKLSGENVRRPLLGAGVVDAAAALDTGPATGVAGASSLRRVTQGCGYIEGHSKGTSTRLLLWLLLALPLLRGGVRTSAYGALIRRVRGFRL